ncbi:PREDICTED: uncharacterized protein LOC105623057 [Atta cephalotes]|uniref:Uncharacterized protein n=1 Tax=Atta cephalotes TaxID=12957 RepID=A0A158NQP4_ATTCE|nr:PREDICTED: uncharacterized protein LOC105623057 [Atta cephalotes]
MRLPDYPHSPHGQRAKRSASNTSDLLNKLLYSTYDIEIHEIISHFLLQMAYTPLKFCGIGFFQFGFKFLHRFVMSIVTVLVIILQA